MSKPNEDIVNGFAAVLLIRRKSQAALDNEVKKRASLNESLTECLFKRGLRIRHSISIPLRPV